MSLLSKWSKQVSEARRKRLEREADDDPTVRMFRHCVQQFDARAESEEKLEQSHAELTALRSSVHELEETVSSLESERNALNIQNAKLLAACEMTWEILNRFGEWDDGCFYYSGKSAPELQRPYEVLGVIFAATKPQGAG